MSKYILSSVKGGRSGSAPIPYGTEWQYRRYIDLLSQNNISPVSKMGKFTDEQLRHMITAFGKCPDGVSCGNIINQMGFDTPIVNPAPGFDPAQDLYKTEIDTGSGKRNTSTKRRAVFSPAGFYTNKYGNTSDYSRPEMTGYNFMPSSFRKTTPTISPEKYGYSTGNDTDTGITSSRFISSTHQRVSGGKIVELPQKLTNVNRVPRSLQDPVSINDPSSSEVIRNLTNLDQTTNIYTGINYVGTTTTINGITVNNSATLSGDSGKAEVNDGGSDDDRDGGGGGGNLPPGGGSDDDRDGGGGGGPGRGGRGGRGGSSSKDYAPFDNQNIRYNTQPLIDITPLEVDSNGNYYAGGPTARASIRRPTPEVSIRQQEFLGIAENSELIINGKKIIIRSPSLTDIKSQVNCAKMGINAFIEGDGTGDGADTGTAELILSSCSGSPFTVANGCGGGTYQQVGDFHINRGFEQQKNRTYNSNAHIIDQNLTTYYTKSGRINRHKWGFLDASGNPIDLDAEDPTKTEAKYTRFFNLPKRNETKGGATLFIDNTSDTSVYSTGGSGYRVGDRLRLVGGTPINNVHAPLTKICIDSAGAGFSNPTDIQILINSDGKAPGFGAAAQVTSLDENGGIATIEMLNYGAGYDLSNPPIIEVYDGGSKNKNIIDIDSSWPADNFGGSIQINSNDYVRIKSERTIINNTTLRVEGTEVSYRYLRAVAPYTFGGQTNKIDVASSRADRSDTITVEMVEDQPWPNRVKISTSLAADLELDTGAAIRPNSYIQVHHYPIGAMMRPFVVESFDDTGGELSYKSADTAGDIIENIRRNRKAFSSESDDYLDADYYRSFAIYKQNETTGEIEQIGVTYNVQHDTDAVVEFDQIFDTTGAAITSADSEGLNSMFGVGDTLYFVAGVVSKFWVPEPAPIDDNSFYDVIGAGWVVVENTAFTNSEQVAQYFPEHSPITIFNHKAWYKGLTTANGNRPELVDTIDPRVPKKQPVLTAKIGINPAPGADLNDPASAFIDGSQSLSGPLRVAKFIVTGVDVDGGITQLRIMDRGLYKIFPSDLTYGIPLEYDYVSDGALGSPDVGSTSLARELVQAARNNSLGVVDPARNNIPYGSAEHPEYGGSPFSTQEMDLQFAFIDPDVWDANKDRNVREVESKGINNVPANQRAWYLRWKASGEPDDQEGMWFFGSDVPIYDLLQRYYAGDKLVGNDLKIVDNYLYGLQVLTQRSTYTAYKHPDWAGYPEFYYNGNEFIPYTGSPGAYDPSTYVIVDSAYFKVDPNIAFRRGKLLKKDKAINLTSNPNDPEYGRYLGYVTTGELEVSGGTGARVFLTAQDVPACTEKGTAKETLELPDEVVALNAPKALARALNNALIGAGYNPQDIKFTVRDVGEIGEVTLKTDYPGVRIESPTPGFAAELGLPEGDWNVGMLCIEATLSDPNLTAAQAEAAVDALYASNAFGVLDAEQAQSLAGLDFGLVDDANTTTQIMSLLCIDRLGPTSTTPPGTLFGAGPGRPALPPEAEYLGPRPLNDNNSIFNAGRSLVSSELYKYDLLNIYGGNVSLGGPSAKQNVDVNIFESRRFGTDNPLDDQFVVRQYDKAWVDDFQGKGWHYFENGFARAIQSEMVDVEHITNAIAYDAETGEKTTDLDFWDPFKGIIPGFIRNEIHHINEVDPVAYQNSRTNFGRNNIGKVWWDTSSVRYEWYEQGTVDYRKRHWGKAFPGSSITICEWVESKALPQNWNGNGVPRWRNRYVTERHIDPATGEHELYYYYWVQNRTVVDDRIKRDLGRKFDTQTIAQYLSNPVGYGLNLVSFVSSDAFTISNSQNYITDNPTHIQVNFSKNLNPDGLKHTAWKLMREGDDASDVPTHASDKMIDSLCEYTESFLAVPDPRLSYVEKYGINFRPRQTMFANAKEARRTMASVLNEILAGLKLNTQYPEWNTELPELMAYAQYTAWYAVRKIDPVTNMNIRYDDSYKPVFNVNSVPELNRLTNLPDGTVIQVNGLKDSSSELWLYNAGENKFKQIAKLNETIQFNDTIFTDEPSPLMALELRAILTSLRDRVFVGTASWNKLFFALMNYAYMEQNQLSWAFKTSYLYVEKEEDDLVQFTGFKPDNFQKVLNYMNEVKPYTAKIREYKDGKRTPIEVIGTHSLSDYDRPPYVDPVTGTVRILDESIEADRQIMENNSEYADYLSQPDKTQAPIRATNTTLTFDRTNWRLTQATWNPTTTSVNQSIAYNIANLTQMSPDEVSANVNTRATDRIFKFDPEVRASFMLEINTQFNDTSAFSNVDVVGNSTVLFGLIENGALDRTLALVKDKVGGGFRGEELDAKRFQTIINDIEYASVLQTEFGFDTVAWDEMTEPNVVRLSDTRDVENYGVVETIGVSDSQWDSVTQLVNYEGVFNTDTQGNVTLRRNDEIVEGFDGVTFQRVLYGEERPEEMALIDPLESVVMTVTTSPFARGSTTVITDYDPVDDTNVTTYYSTVSVADVNIINGGIGYVNPVVEFFDAVGNQPTQSARGNAVVTNGVITDINIEDSGAGYESIGVRVYDQIEYTTSAVSLKNTNILHIVNSSLVSPGQILRLNGVQLGVVESYTPGVITLDRLLVFEVPNNSMITAQGHSFDATVEIATTTEAVVYIDRAYAEQELLGIVPFTDVPGDPTLVQITDPAYTTFADISAVLGKDPDNDNLFFGLGVDGAWDSATENGKQGSWDVSTSSAAEQIVESIPYGSEVTYRVHQNLFGSTDYLRIRPDTTTELVEPLYSYSEQIVLADASFLPDVTTQEPGMLWVGDERVHYARISGNTLSLLTRGALGTSIQDHQAGTPVYSTETGELFNNLNPKSNIWLDTGTRYTAPASWDEAIQIAGAETPNDDSDDVWDIQRAWDEISNTNITVSTVTGTVTAVVMDGSNITSSTVSLVTPANVAVGEGVKVTNNVTGNSQVVLVDQINGNDITVVPDSRDEMNNTVFVQNDAITFQSFNYAGQEPSDRWDSATIIGQTAISLADRANADFTLENSIMRFLHNL